MVGVCFTGLNIYLCGTKVFVYFNSSRAIHNFIQFYQFPVSSDVNQADPKNITTSFPTITFCLNSMHSKSKILKFHPQAQTSINNTKDYFLQTLGFLYGFYYDTHEGSIQDMVQEIKKHGTLLNVFTLKFIV